MSSRTPSWSRGTSARPLPLLSREEYTDIICDLLQRLDPAIVVHRLAADREKELFVAPLWALNKPAVLQAIRGKMMLKGAYQGQLHDAGQPRPTAH